MNKTGDEIFLPNRTVELIGLMGCGKSTIGRKLAALWGLPFHDVDQDIEKDQGVSVTEIFEQRGEPAFRVLERSKIMELSKQGVMILSPGGGAFANDETRAMIQASGALTVWLDVQFETLLKRVTSKKSAGKRPLLKEDPAGALRKKLDEREPFYRQADLTVICEDVPIDVNVRKVAAAVRAKLALG